MRDETLFNLTKDLVEYIEQRKAESDYFTPFGLFKGMTKTVKVSAATKLLDLINDKTDITFTPIELKALNDCRLGGIAKFAQHLFAQQSPQDNMSKGQKL